MKPYHINSKTKPVCCMPDCLAQLHENNNRHQYKYYITDFVTQSHLHTTSDTNFSTWGVQRAYHLVTGQGWCHHLCGSQEKQMQPSFQQGWMDIPWLWLSWMYPTLDHPIPIIYLLGQCQITILLRYQYVDSHAHFRGTNTPLLQGGYHTRVQRSKGT